MDCPICMELIEVSKNCVNTECGHCFHANCLMKSVAHNGFGCPYCRTVMAETPEEDTDDDDYTNISDSEADSEEEEDEDDILRGFRLFHNCINGQQHDEADLEEEREYNQYIQETNENVQELHREYERLTPITHISKTLSEQGITFEQLVSIILYNGHAYHSEELKTLDNNLYGKIRSIIAYHNPEQVDGFREML
jgi:hypothetical protein